MVCCVCSGWAQGALCGACERLLLLGGVRRLAGGLLVGFGLCHTGVARTLVHRLKYQGIRRAASVLAPHMAVALQGRRGTLVPIPRVPARKWRYAIDPARELAGALSTLTGLPVSDVLAVPAWEPARAGVGRAARSAPRFSAHSTPPGRVILVDDVLTTGATLTAAGRCIGECAMYGVTATAAGRVVV
jgi:predicted amidophosphoribosyltransferase